jgi:hypothetical protein
MTLEDIRKKIVELKKIPEPEIQIPMAMCYSMVMLAPEDFEYVCPKCGEKTLYPKTPVHRIREVFESRRLVYALKHKITINEFNSIWDYYESIKKFEDLSHNTDINRFDELVKLKKQDDMNPSYRDSYDEYISHKKAQNEFEALDIELIESEFCANCTKKSNKSPQLGIKINYNDKIVFRHPISFKDLEIIHDFIAGKLQISYNLGRDLRSMHSSISKIEYLLGITDKKPEQEPFNTRYFGFE